MLVDVGSADAVNRFMNRFSEAVKGSLVKRSTRLVFAVTPTPKRVTIREVADVVGFPYRHQAALDQYIHPVGFIVADGDGRISRYLVGVDTEAPDLRAALDDAAAGKSFSLVKRLLLLCHGDTPQLGRYSLAIEAAFIVANLAAMVGGIAVFAAIRRRRHG